MAQELDPALGGVDRVREGFPGVEIFELKCILKAFLLFPSGFC